MPGCVFRGPTSACKRSGAFVGALFAFGFALWLARRDRRTQALFRKRLSDLFDEAVNDPVWTGGS